MEFVTLFQPLNYLAVIAAALIQFVLGYFWYSKAMFADSWTKEVGLKDSDFKNGLGMKYIMPITVVLYFFISLVLAMIIGSGAELSSAVNMAVIIGLGLISALTGIHYLYERRSLRLFIINAGYNVFGLILAAIILSLWQ
jgi:hypothetical protein